MYAQAKGKRGIFMAKFSIGIDFGTQSGRAVLVNVETGEEVATSVKEYTHGVMDESLPDGTKLPHDWALQHPQDYIEVLATTVPDVLKKAGVSKDDVIGIGIDFTACTCFLSKRMGHRFVSFPSSNQILMPMLSCGNTMLLKSMQIG